MKRIETYLDERFYYLVLSAYFEFLKQYLTSDVLSKTFVYQITDEIKGVRHKALRQKVNCTLDCLDKKISEEFYVDFRYEERSKNIFVTFTSKHRCNYIKSLGAIKKERFKDMLSGWFNELAWGLLEAFLPVEEGDFNNCRVLQSPKNRKVTRPQMKKFYKFDIFSDEILTILYSLYNCRKNSICFVKVCVEDILFLRGIKAYGKSFKQSDKKRVKEAIEALSDTGLIRAKKLKRYEYAIIVPQNLYSNIYFVPKDVMALNYNRQNFEKVLGDYLSRLVQAGKFEMRLSKIIRYLLEKNKYLKPSRIRDKIENALDTLVDCSVIKCWEYRKINEEELSGRDWLDKYKKLRIIFRTKKAG